MPQVDAAPNFERAGVISGFVLSLGSGLTPAITRGVLFAQGTMYRPESAPNLPEAPVSAMSWLFYNSSSGFYWAPSFAPATSGDAFLGWAVTGTSAVIAVSAQKIGPPPEPDVIPLGEVLPQEPGGIGADLIQVAYADYYA